MKGFRERRRGDFDGQAGTGASRRHGHDPVPGEIDVDGVPMAVDRCRDCGIVVLDPGRPGGPCPGPNHTLTEFGIVPPTERDENDSTVLRYSFADSRSIDSQEDDTGVETPPTLVPR